MATWNDLEKNCLACRTCALADTRTHVVFGDGNPSAELLFIGEGPGEQEDLEGKPFVGRAGILLDDMLSLIGLTRAEFYITNIVKCRPPENRDPLHVEQDACIRHLHAQIAILKPKLIVCLGRVAALQFIDPKFKITQDHGKWFEWQGIPIMALYHPAALLRDPTKGPDTFIDLKGLQAQLAMHCPTTKLTVPLPLDSDEKKT